MPKTSPDPDSYREFISQLKLEEIYLSTLSLKKGQASPQGGTVIVGCKPSIKECADGRLVVDFTTKSIGKISPGVDEPTPDKLVFSIQCTFTLRYRIPEDASRDMAQFFVGRNLLLNVWPYVRELTNSLTLRMNLPPAILELEKIIEA